MNAGLAVIVSDQAGCGPDLVKSVENGCVFKARDIAGLRLGLHNFLHNQQKCRGLGRKSLEIIDKWRI
jgi:hypothetical protein